MELLRAALVLRKPCANLLIGACLMDSLRVPYFALGANSLCAIGIEKIPC